MSHNANVQVVKEAYEAWNAYDVERATRLMAADAVVESDTLPQAIHGREGFRQFMRTYIVAFPDLQFQIQSLIASGDLVAEQWTATGTHRGDLMGIAPTGRRTVTHGCTVHEVKNGSITHQWVYWDAASLLRQLGVLQSAEAAATG